MVLEHDTHGRNAFRNKLINIHIIKSRYSVYHGKSAAKLC